MYGGVVVSNKMGTISPMMTHRCFLRSMLFLALAAATGCEKSDSGSDSGEYVYANFVSGLRPPQGDLNSNPIAEYDILLVITSPAYSGTEHLHWHGRAGTAGTTQSWRAFLAQCDSELKERCGVNLPPLDGVSPTEFQGIFFETMSESEYNGLRGESWNNTTNKVGDYRFDFYAYKRR